MDRARLSLSLLPLSLSLSLCPSFLSVSISVSVSLYLSPSLSLSRSISLALFRFLYLSLLLHTQEPTLRLIIIHLKYADWRRAFLIAWRLWRGVGMLGSEATVDDRAALVLQALEATCRAQHLEGDDNLSDESKAWADNLGHNIAYVSSPLSLLGRLGVVKKCPPEQKGALRLGPQKNMNFLRRLCSAKERPHVRRRLVKWVRLADAIGVVQAPRTCRSWAEQFQNLQQKMRVHRAALLRPFHS